MRLENIHTKNFLADPKSVDFEKELISRSSIFDLKKNKKKWLTYIALVYDVQSELRRNNRDSINRKFEGAKLAGFELNDDGHFSKDIEDILLGKDDHFNQAVNQFVYYQFNNDYKLLYVLEEKYDIQIKEQAMSLKPITAKDRENLTETKNQIEELIDKIFGGTETINMLKALYQGLDNVRDRIPRLEVAVDEYEKNGLDPYCPFPNKYRPNKLKFVGDSIPITKT